MQLALLVAVSLGMLPEVCAPPIGADGLVVTRGGVVLDLPGGETFSASGLVASDRPNGPVGGLRYSAESIDEMKVEVTVVDSAALTPDDARRRAGAAGARDNAHGCAVTDASEPTRALLPNGREGPYQVRELVVCPGHAVQVMAEGATVTAARVRLRAVSDSVRIEKPSPVPQHLRDADDRALIGCFRVSRAGDDRASIQCLDAGGTARSRGEAEATAPKAPPPGWSAGRWAVWNGNLLQCLEGEHGVVLEYGPATTADDGFTFLDRRYAREASAAVAPRP